MAAVAAPTQAGHAPGHRSTAPSIEAVRMAFPQLEILELIGQGGMGAVFKARQPKLNRFVALKILHESMAPEQRSSPSTVDPRADIYSLGVVFYEMLTGELPTGNFAPPSTRTPMDPRVDEVVMRAMARPPSLATSRLVH